MKKPRVLILGLDGIGLDLVEQFRVEGALPNLSALMRQGAWGELQSTVPPTTLPAWTSFMTGASPAEHGIPDFTIRRDYSVSFVNARHRRLPTLFHHLGQGGLDVGAAWFPATYPPEKLKGYQIAGWDSPVTSKGDPSFVYPRDLHHELEWQFGDEHLVFDAIDEFSNETAWYRSAAAGLLDSVDRRRRVALWLLEHRPVDVAAFYFGETDTAAHHFWAFHDRSSPRRPASFEPALSRVLRDTYRAVDQAVGELIEACGPSTSVVVLSDHGSGGSSDLALHINRMLEQAGLLHFASDRGSRMGSKWLRGVGPGLLPPMLRRQAFRLAGGLAPTVAESFIRFGGIDWSRTQAFSEELNYAPGIWLNLRGREPGGIVDESQRDSVHRALLDAAKKVTSPTGLPLIKDVIRRETIHDGPQLELFPDFIVELARPAGYTPACLPSQGRSGPIVTRLAGKDLLGRKGRSLPGCHTPTGFFAVRSSELSPGRLEGVRLEHIAPVVTALAGVEGAAWFKHEPPAGLPTPEGVARSQHDAVSDESPVYSREEERIIGERLRRLGYLE